MRGASRKAKVPFELPSTFVPRSVDQEFREGATTSES